MIKDTISASRVAAILGLDPYLSPLTMFLLARGEIEEKDIGDDEAVLQGRFYERATADIACHKYGMTIVPGFEQMEMRDGCLSGHPDFVAIDEHGNFAVLEVKNPFFAIANSDEWGDPGTDLVPKRHFIQSLTYNHLLMMWSKSSNDDFANAFRSNARHGGVADYAYVIARLRGGVERYKIPYDKQVIAKIESEVAMFLDRVERNDPPDPRDEQDMRRRWAADPGKVAECNDAMLYQMKALQDVKAQIKALEEQKEQIQTMILGFAQDASAIEYVDEFGARTMVATAKASRQFNKEKCFAEHGPRLIEKGLITIDTTRLAKEQKALYESYMEVVVERGKQRRSLLIQGKELDRLMEVKS